MKSWGDLPAPRRRPPVRIEPSGHGLVRRDIVVLVPELALQGAEVVCVSVLEDPDTGDWFGEDPHYPGSALVAIDKDRVVRPTPHWTAALEEVASAARRLLGERIAEAVDTFTHRGLEQARQVAADLPHPDPKELALDLGRVVRGPIQSPATWWRTPDGVRLKTVRSEDDPLGWIEEWSSTEDLLVLDGPATRKAIQTLVATIANDPCERPDEIREAVRQDAIELLALVAPNLAQLAVGPGDP